MSIDEIPQKLSDGATLEGPHWSEPVKVLTVKARGARVEVQAVGLHTKRLWNKLLKAEDFDGAVTITQAGELAVLTGNPTHFGLAAEAHPFGWPSSTIRTSPCLCRRGSAAAPDGRGLLAPAHPAADTLPDRRRPRRGQDDHGRAHLEGTEAPGTGRADAVIATLANLTDQWRRELQDKFGESFTVINRDTVGAASGQVVQERELQHARRIRRSTPTKTWNVLMIEEEFHWLMFDVRDV
jgi:hypothetical protein